MTAQEVNDLIRTTLPSFKTTNKVFTSGDIPYRTHITSNDPATRVNTHWIEPTQKHPAHGTIEVKVRTSGSGYRTVRNTRFTTREQLKSVLNDVSKLANGEITTTIQPPHKFRETHFTEDDRGWFSNTNVIAHVKIVKMVTIQPDGRVTDDIHTPGRDCWYLLDCSGHQGATFNLLTDGDTFYVTNRITDSTKTIAIKTGYSIGKDSVDLKETNQTDKALINAAIQAWVAKLGAN